MLKGGDVIEILKMKSANNSLVLNSSLRTLIYLPSQYLSYCLRAKGCPKSAAF